MQKNKAAQMYAFGVFIVMFTVAVCNALQSALLSDMIGNYQLKDALQGGMSAFQSLGVLFALIVTILASGKIKKQYILLILTATVALASFGIGRQPGILLFIASFLVMGVGKGFADSSTSSVIADLYPGEEAVDKIGLLHGFYGIGSLLTPLAVNGLKNFNYRWNQIYTFAACFAILVFVFMAFLTAKTKSKLHSLPETPQQITVKELRGFFQTKRNIFLLLGIFCYASYQIGYFLWISRYVEVYLGNAQMGPIALSLFWLGITLARIFITKLKFNKLKTVIIGNIAVILFVLIAVWSKNIFLAVVCSFFAGFINGATTPIQISTGCGWYLKNTILVTTVIYLVFNMAQIVCPLLVAAINSVDMQIAMATCSIFALLTAVFTVPLLKMKPE